MPVTPRLDVVDGAGRRTVDVTPLPFAIGRRETNHLQLGGSEVSRDHAEIVQEGTRFILRDKRSRFGTFVNGDAVPAERALLPGDVIRLGRSGGAELVFHVGPPSSAGPPSTPLGVSVVAGPAAGAIGDLRHVARLLEGLRALGTGRVLDDVLALVLDSAIDVSGAERGFIMLADTDGALEFKMGRGRGQLPLEGSTFQTSRKIPEEVFETGNARLIADLLDGDLANVHMGTVALGIRHVLCVPLDVVRYVEDATAVGPIAARRIGVLYLDSRERGALLAASTRGALETLAAEASLAIENARLYRSALEKAKLEQDIRIAAEIQQALLPKPRHGGAFFDTSGTTIPCRSIGGDFFDVIDIADDVLGFALGDVAGKGPPAALLSALVQGIIAGQTTSAGGPSETLARVNRAMIRRAVAARYATMFYAELHADGRLVYGNAGHNPPIVVGPGGIRRLEAGGPPVGLFEGLPYAQGEVQLVDGDRVIVFSDGVSEACNIRDEEFGDARIIELASSLSDPSPEALVDALIAEVRSFTGAAPQGDDITALVVAYRPPA
jgi:serine phosphatase RsbU (regulator of sigma subunit)/pSer/pThr/pTyr-binding forkhead associated (FHA) protein